MNNEKKRKKKEWEKQSKQIEVKWNQFSIWAHIVY